MLQNCQTREELRNFLRGITCIGTGDSTCMIALKMLVILFSKINLMPDHQISLEEAVSLTTRYRNNRMSILNEEYSQDTNLLPLCETFDKTAVQTLLSSEACKSFRIYYGMNEDLSIHAVLVGVDDNGADILPVGADPSFQLLENSVRCPPNCPPASPLNE